MKNKLLLTAFVIALLTGLQSCAVVGGIFKAGTVTGAVIVVVIIALIIFLISRAFKNK